MLARTFKTAVELGIPEHEHAALVTVLYMIEDGVIKPEELVMYTFTNDCGTSHCLAGWANAINADAFPELLKSNRAVAALFVRLPRNLTKVFGISHPMMRATPDQAKAALRTYLETGKGPAGD